ncbi:AbrB/MazE/SpoVT family DNA-binding domain-containing protein [Patescibacteria group bacterium]|nr:AbrB/MazE/SpoVT family DNA-binding domain-containing protein [Patescibacteria group bacterium]
MTYLATITDKRQVTIPVDVYRAMEMKKGQKVIVQVGDRIISMRPVEDLVNKLAGSVKIPVKYKNMDVDKIVAKAKRVYFDKKLMKEFLV